MVAAVLFGAGFGVYLAVDTALITQVLPAAADRAKDLGRHQHRHRRAAGARPGLAAPIVDLPGRIPDAVRAHRGGHPGRGGGGGENPLGAAR